MHQSVNSVGLRQNGLRKFAVCKEGGVVDIEALSLDGAWPSGFRP